MSMRISPRFTSSDWKRLTFTAEDDWRLAVDIFTDRIRERFLDPIARIEKCAYAGFAVVALDCLLIEMLQQFREGVNRTPAGKSKEFFVNFLTGFGFGEHFDTRKAELFYRQIRCGILHQAEMRGSSKILVGDSMPLVKYSDDNKGLLVNRIRFHQQLLETFEHYIAELLSGDSDQLRARFRTKMSSICRAACEVV